MPKAFLVNIGTARFSPSFSLINWVILFFLINMGQNFYPHFKKNIGTACDLSKRSRGYTLAAGSE
jgi:hypothetical protein